MTLFNMMDLRAQLEPGQRLLGIDPGSKRIGLALSDVRCAVASPYGTIKRGKLAPIAAEILRIASREDVGGLVIGLPLADDGSLGRAGQAARDWAHAVAEATELPTAMWDESLTTAGVHEMLIGEADLSRARRAEVIDKLAAAAILQSALDATNPQITQPDE